MPITNLTVDDSSPWITYNGAWGDSDTNTEAYTGGTFHFTQDPTANAVITFNGTGITLVGAKRQNHGLYGVSLDGNSVGTFQGTTPDVAGDFNFTLFSNTKLSQQQHTVILRNLEPKFVDIDYAILQVGDGNPNTKSTNITMDDTHPNVTYDSHWTAGSNSLSPQYFNSTFHASGAANTAAKISFFGNAIALYGATSTNHATYSVSIDSAPASTFNGSSIKPVFRAQRLLYYISNLPSGMHTATLTNLQDQFFTDFDYAMIEQYESAPASSPGTSAGDTTGSGSSKSGNSGGGSSDTPIGPIVGGIIGGLVLLGIIAFLLFLIFRQRRRNADDAASYARKGQDALGSELAPGVSVAAMASYGGLRGPSPQRSYDDFPAQNGVGYSPGAAAGMAGASSSMHSGRSPMATQYGQAGYAIGGSSTNQLIAGGARNGGAPEMDMPPPDYDRVFSPVGSSVSGSQPAPDSSVGGSAYGGYGPGPASSVTSASGGGGGVMGGFPPPNPAETRVYRQLQEKGIPIPANRDVGVNRMQ